MKDHLINSGASDSSIQLIQSTLDYAGKQRRDGDLFSNKDLFSKAGSLMKSMFNDAPVVYTQHTPYIMNLVESLEKSKLRENEFPSMNMKLDK